MLFQKVYVMYPRPIVLAKFYNVLLESLCLSIQVTYTYLIKAYVSIQYAEVVFTLEGQDFLKPAFIFNILL